MAHEMTGEVIEKSRDAEYLDAGGLVSVPFNIACGRWRCCKEGATGVIVGDLIDPHGMVAAA